MKRVHLFGVPVLGLLAHVWAGGPEPSGGDAAGVAKEAARAAFGRLSGELAAAVSEKGVAAAVSVCSERAPEILAATGRERGVEMRRASDRNRNPEGKAGELDLKALEFFRERLEREEKPVPHVERKGDGSAVVVRLPITINSSLCLKCHGMEEEIGEATLAAIREVYPADRATGYREGDLRGLWRITVPAEGPEEDR